MSNKTIIVNKGIKQGLRGITAKQIVAWEGNPEDFTLTYPQSIRIEKCYKAQVMGSKRIQVFDGTQAVGVIPPHCLTEIIPHKPPRTLGLVAVPEYLNYDPTSVYIDGLLTAYFSSPWFDPPTQESIEYPSIGRYVIMRVIARTGQFNYRFFGRTKTAPSETDIVPLTAAVNVPAVGVYLIEDNTLERFSKQRRLEITPFGGGPWSLNIRVTQLWNARSVTADYGQPGAATRALVYADGRVERQAGDDYINMPNEFIQPT